MFWIPSIIYRVEGGVPDIYLFICNSTRVARKNISTRFEIKTISCYVISCSWLQSMFNLYNHKHRKRDTLCSVKHEKPNKKYYSCLKLWFSNILIAFIILQFFNSKNISKQRIFIEHLNRRPITDRSSTSCFVRSLRFIVNKHDSYVVLPSTSANFHP